MKICIEELWQNACDKLLEDWGGWNIKGEFYCMRKSKSQEKQ